MNNTQSKFPDLTFVIPFYYDGEFRLENLYCVLKILGRFNANVMVVEQGSCQHFTNTDYYFDNAGINGQYCFVPNKNVCEFISSNYVRTAPHGNFEFLSQVVPITTILNDIFYRTRIINIGLKKVKTKYFAIYDTDVFFKDEKYVYAYKKLKEGFTFVYPYDGKFVDIERQYIKDGIIKEKESFANGSYGGAVFGNLSKYQECGLENENLIGWSPDDVERQARVSILGRSICRIEGKCYHILHPKIGFASSANPFNEQNLKEYGRVMNMKKEELKEYIKNWNWTK